MNGQKSRSRLVAGVSIPMAILLLIFFFLPWVNLQCAGMQIGKATGWQLAVGKITVDMSDMGGAEAKQEQGKDPDARPVFFLGLLVPLAILIVGVCSLKGSIGTSPTGVWLTALGVVGLIVMIMAANVDYADEMSEDAKKSDQRSASAPPATGDPGEAMSRAMEGAMKDQMEKQMSAPIQTQATGIVWTCLILYVLVAIAGASCFLKIGVSAGPAASQAPTAAAAPPPGPAPAQPPAQDQPPCEPPAQ